MSFRMPSIYPRRVWVTSGPERSMNKAENATAKTGCCSGGHSHSGHDHGDHHGDGHKIVRDPVCGMSVDPATSKHRFEHGSETHHFCSAGCRTKFAANPTQYLDKTNPKP